MRRACVTMRVTQADGYVEPRDSISQDWSTLLLSWDISPLPVPNIGSAAVDYVREFEPSLLILSGGEDVGIVPKRDATETALLAFAMDHGVPVLGVCRGMQLINSRLGGSLDVVAGHVATPHDVIFADGWEKHYGQVASVNSYHSIAVPADGVAPPLRATATDTAGNVEALQHQSLPIAAVMWHPERQGAPAGDRALIENLIGQHS